MLEGSDKKVMVLDLNELSNPEDSLSLPSFLAAPSLACSTTFANRRFKPVLDAAAAAAADWEIAPLPRADIIASLLFCPESENAAVDGPGFIWLNCWDPPICNDDRPSTLRFTNRSSNGCESERFTPYNEKKVKVSRQLPCSFVQSRRPFSTYTIPSKTSSIDNSLVEIYRSNVLITEQRMLRSSKLILKQNSSLEHKTAVTDLKVKNSLKISTRTIW